MALAIVNSAASRIGSLATEEISFLYGVDNKVKRLEDELIMASSFLLDADQKQQHSEVIRTVVSKIRDIAYEAEDIVEKYYIEHSEQLLLRQEGISNTLKWLGCLFCNAKSLHEVGSDIDALMERLSDLTSQLQRYNIIRNHSEETSSSSSAPETNPLNRTFSFVQVDDTVGLDKDTEILVNHLVHENTYSAIIISGMGGLGKSTLAKRVFKDPNVAKRFNKCAWVFVSQQFQETTILKSILKKLCHDDRREMEIIQTLEDNMLHGRLYRILQNKKCLIVLDDIWRVEAWKRLVPAFHSIRTSPSKLLITTRNEKLLSYVDPSAIFLHRVQFLNDDDSWELFQRKAFCDRTTPDVEMEQLGRQMVTKCKGLPLAVLALSGILRSHRETKKWQDVHRNMHRYLNDERVQLDEYMLVNKVLELSYNDLPLHLRLCFLYMSGFPEDFQIPVKKLRRLWEAENFMILPKKDSMEVITDYLNQLLQRNLIQVGGLTKSGKIKTYHLHDMMRDMGMNKAREENFFHVFQQDENLTDDQQKVGFSSFTRGKSLQRLAMHLIFKSSIQFDYDAMDDCARLRSLMLFSSLPWDLIKVINKTSPVLRVLDLEGLRMEYFPEEISDLIHLRYLSLKDTGVKELPPLMGKLRLLQTLDLRTGRYTVILPNKLWKMQKMVHLYLPVMYHCTDGEMLMLSGLKHLETLININPSKVRINDVLVLNKLERVSFAYDNTSGLKDETIKDLFLLWASLSLKHGIKPFSVVITGTMLKKEPLLLARLYNDHRMNFSSCQLSLYRLKKRAQLVLPPSLSVLVLNEIEFEEDPMSILEMLPHLRCLALFDCLKIKKMVCSQRGFPQLKILLLSYLQSLNEWKVEEEGMLNLKQLGIYNCPGLQRKQVAELMTIMMKGKITCQGQDITEQFADPDMKKLYNLCSLYQKEEDANQASPMIRDIENTLNKVLSTDKLSPSDAKKILHWLGTSWTILAGGRVTINSSDQKIHNYVGRSLLFKSWTWDY